MKKLILASAVLAASALTGCQSMSNVPLDSSYADAFESAGYSVSSELLTYEYQQQIHLDSLTGDFYYNGCNTGGFGMEQNICFIYHPNSDKQVRVSVNYHGTDWIFANEAKVFVDKKEIATIFDQSPRRKVNDYAGSVGIYEEVSMNLSLEQAKAIAYANDKITLRFYGKDGYIDTYAPFDKERLQHVITLAESTNRLTNK